MKADHSDNTDYQLLSSAEAPFLRGDDIRRSSRLPFVTTPRPLQRLHFCCGRYSGQEGRTGRAFRLSPLLILAPSAAGIWLNTHSANVNEAGPRLSGLRTEVSQINLLIFFRGPAK